jgi:hypothetical protein
VLYEGRKEMKTFKKARSMKNIRKNLAGYGFSPDRKPSDMYSDFTYFKNGMVAGVAIPTLGVDPALGRFIGRVYLVVGMQYKEVTFSHCDGKYDNDEWYSRLLDAIYEPAEEARAEDARIINELEEQQCHLCGDESFDAGWKAGLEKAIEMIREKKSGKAQYK